MQITSRCLLAKLCSASQGAPDNSDKPRREDSDAQELANIRGKIRVRSCRLEIIPRAGTEPVCEVLAGAAFLIHGS